MIIPFLPFKVKFEGEEYEVLAISDNPETTYFLVADHGESPGFDWLKMEDCQSVKED